MSAGKLPRNYAASLQLISNTSAHKHSPGNSSPAAWNWKVLRCGSFARGAACRNLVEARPRASALSAELDLPAGTILDTLNDPIALSPDGHRLALALLGPDGKAELWVRQLDTGRAERVPSTHGAEYPFWSPDGASIGFFADGKLKRIELASGIGQDICEALHGRGAAWNAAGSIVFAPDAYGSLSLVPSSGGAPAELGIPIQPNDSLRLPRFLPDNDHFLFLRFPQDGPSQVKVFSLSSRHVTDLVQADAAAQYSAPSQLVFVRNGNLFAQKYDPGAASLSGSPTQIATGIQTDPARSTAAFSSARCQHNGPRRGRSLSPYKKHKHPDVGEATDSQT